MPLNPETGMFEQSPSTIVDSTPDGDTVKQGFDERNSPALTQVYEDFNMVIQQGTTGVPDGVTIKATGHAWGVNYDDTLSVKGGKLAVNNVVQEINPDPTLASVDKVPSEQAVSEEFAKRTAYIVDYYPKTEAEKASANGNWWIKWSNGFVMQGGKLSTIGVPVYVYLLVPYTSTNYLCFKHMGKDDGTANYEYLGFWNQTTTYMTTGGNNNNEKWLAMGFN